jgi:hypothetical protein
MLARNLILHFVHHDALNWTEFTLIRIQSMQDLLEIDYIFLIIVFKVDLVNHLFLHIILMVLLYPECIDLIVLDLDIDNFTMHMYFFYDLFLILVIAHNLPQSALLSHCVSQNSHFSCCPTFHLTTWSRFI